MMIRMSAGSVPFDVDDIQLCFRSVAPAASTSATPASCRQRVEEELRRELRPIVEAQLREELREQMLKRVAHIYATVSQRERERAARRSAALFDAWSGLYPEDAAATAPRQEEDEDEK